MEAPSNCGDTFQPDIAGFFCGQCGDDDRSESGESHDDFPPSLKNVRIICAGDVSPDLIRDAFSVGADGVLICGCLVGKCESLNVNSKVLAHIHQAKIVLKEMAIAPGRLRQEWVCAPGGDNIRDIVDDFTEKIRVLGPLQENA